MTYVVTALSATAPLPESFIRRNTNGGCRRGACDFRCWPEADMDLAWDDVRYQGESGHGLLQANVR